MEKYACKMLCEKCGYCNKVEGGFIDCFFGVYYDPTTDPRAPIQTTLEKFHKCYNFARIDDSK